MSEEFGWDRVLGYAHCEPVSLCCSIKALTTDKEDWRGRGGGKIMITFFFWICTECQASCYAFTVL